MLEYWVTLIDQDLLAVVGLAAGLFVACVILGQRVLRLYSPDEIGRDPANPTVTTFAKRCLLTTKFYENGILVAKTHILGQGNRGIVLRIKGRLEKYLFTSEGDWFEETRFRLKSNVRLILFCEDQIVVTADRVCQKRSWSISENGKFTISSISNVPKVASSLDG